MKKVNESNNTIKYLNPSRGDLKRPLSKVHTRSMVDLQAICNPSKDKKNHFTSYNDGLNETQFFQSNSISKLAKKIEASVQQPFSSKSKKCKNITNFSMKTMKENLNQKAKENNQAIVSQKNQNYQLVFKLKKYIEELKNKQKTYVSQIQQLKKENRTLSNNANNYQQQIKQLKAKQSMLIATIKQHEHQQKRVKKDHELVVESLKQVINQQITKIISLEKQKIEINKKYEQGQQSEKSFPQPINIKSRSISSRSQSSFDKRETIREVTQENESEENLSNQQKDDKLLHEVDQYLSQWFTKKIR